MKQLIIWNKEYGSFKPTLFGENEALNYFGSIAVVKRPMSFELVDAKHLAEYISESFMAETFSGVITIYNIDGSEREWRELFSTYSVDESIARLEVASND